MTAASLVALHHALPSMDAAEAMRSRVLFCGRLADALAAWIPGLTLQPLPAGAPPGPADPGSRFQILLRGHCAELVLQMPAAVDAVSAAILAAGAWSPAVQLNCLLARAKSSLAILVRCLDALGLEPVALQPLSQTLSAAGGGTLFACQVGEHRILGCLRSSHDRWLAELEQFFLQLRPQGERRLTRLIVPVRTRWGTRRIRLGLLRSLQAGDVLLLDGRQGNDGPGRAALLVVGSLRGCAAAARCCTLQGARITITGDQWMNIDTLRVAPDQVQEAPLPSPGQGPVSDPLADVEVDLHFELQVLSTPLAELAAMRPGYVIELPMAAAEASVSLLVAGQVIGRAQLVSIGDRLGARILELSHADR